jgi:hypothetical protein
MKELYRNEFIEMMLDQDNSIIEMAWLPRASRLSDELFRQIFNTYAELVDVHHPSFYLTYSKGGDYIIPPHLQQWLAENVIPRTYEAGVKTTAIVISHDIFTQVAAEQVFDEKNARVLSSRFFPDYEQARQWLLKLAAKKNAS